MPAELAYIYWILSIRLLIFTGYFSISAWQNRHIYICYYIIFKPLASLATHTFCDHCLLTGTSHTNIFNRISEFFRFRPKFTNCVRITCMLCQFWFIVPFFLLRIFFSETCFENETLFCYKTYKRMNVLDFRFTEFYQQKFNFSWKCVIQVDILSKDMFRLLIMNLNTTPI